MAHYVILGNFTEQGIENVKDAPKRREDFRKAVEAAHGKLVLHLYTMGPHDFVSIVELPSDEAVNGIILRSAALGNVRTITLKAWTPDEFDKFVRP
jgi:uncharacterized protein with GYD domain